MRTDDGPVRRLALAILFWLPLTGAARAETPAAVAQRWGLIGSWSADCSLPADRDRGTVLTYEIGADRRLKSRRRFGDATDEAEVLEAAVSADGTLNLRVHFSSLEQTREFGLMKQPDGSIRAIYNRSETGEYTIRDGKFTRDGRATPPQRRCE